MNEEHAFAQEVRDNPHDDTPRLIYADYLEEAGDPRGELIRVQVELAHCPPADPRRAELAARERELLDTYAERWLAPLRELGAEGVSARCFQRGLIERVRVQAAAFLTNGEKLCEIAPALSYVILKNAKGTMDQIAAAAFPPQIRSLDLSGNRLNAEDLGYLSGAPPWGPQIVDLSLEFNQLGDAEAQTLASVELLRLEKLALDANVIAAEGAAALAGWESLANLKTLALNINRLGNEGAASLAGATRLSNLEDLDLSSNGIGDDGAVAISASGAFASLRKLILRANAINTAGFQALANSTNLNRLEMLDVRNNAGHPPAELRQRFSEAKVLESAAPSSRYM